MNNYQLVFKHKELNSRVVFVGVTDESLNETMAFCWANFSEPFVDNYYLESASFSPFKPTQSCQEKEDQKAINE